MRAPMFVRDANSRHGLRQPMWNRPLGDCHLRAPAPLLGGWGHATWGGGEAKQASQVT